MPPFLDEIFYAVIFKLLFIRVKQLIGFDFACIRNVLNIFNENIPPLSLNCAYIDAMKPIKSAITSCVRPFSMRYLFANRIYVI